MNQLIPFDDNTKLALSAGLSAIPDDEFESGQRGGFPVLSIKGKNFTMVRAGERTLMMRPGPDGKPSDEPATALEIVVVRSVPGVSKAWYPNAYVEGSVDNPECYSNDGVAPAPDAENPQCKTCAACQHNKWGSKISDEGKKLKECQDSKRLAIAPLGLLSDVMLLKVPAGSLKAWDEYVQMLRKRGVTPPMVGTKLTFDFTVAYPSLVFKGIGVLPPAMQQEVLAARESDEALAITGGVRSLVEAEAEVETAPEPAGQTKPEPAAPRRRGRPPKAAETAAKPEPAAEPTTVPKVDDALSAALDEALAGLNFDI